MSTVRHDRIPQEPPASWIDIARLVLTEKGAAWRVVLVITLPLLAIVALIVVPVLILGPAGFAGLVPVAGAALGGKKYLDKRRQK